jgi:hypothetical protein
MAQLTLPILCHATSQFAPLHLPMLNRCICQFQIVEPPNLHRCTTQFTSQYCTVLPPNSPDDIASLQYRIRLSILHSCSSQFCPVAPTNSLDKSQPLCPNPAPLHLPITRPNLNPCAPSSAQSDLPIHLSVLLRMLTRRYRDPHSSPVSVRDYPCQVILAYIMRLPRTSSIEDFLGRFRLRSDSLP